MWHIPNVEIKDYNVIIDGKNFFDQPVKIDKITYENIRKVAISQGDVRKFTYCKKHCKIIFNRFK